MSTFSAARQIAPRGRQASLGLFGVADFEAPLRWLPRSPRATLIRGVLNSSNRDGLSAAHYSRPSASAHACCPSLHDEPELVHSRWLADLAESCGFPFDEEAAHARSFAGAGHAEHLMALEG